MKKSTSSVASATKNQPKTKPIPAAAIKPLTALLSDDHKTQLADSTIKDVQVKSSLSVASIPSVEAVAATVALEEQKALELPATESRAIDMTPSYVLLGTGQSNETGSATGQIPSLDNSSKALLNLYQTGPNSAYKIQPASHPGVHHTRMNDSVTPAIITAATIRDSPIAAPQSKVVVVLGGFAGAGYRVQSKTWAERGQMVNHGNYSFDVAFRPGGSKPQTMWSATAAYAINDWVVYKDSQFICVVAHTATQEPSIASLFWSEIPYGYKRLGAWNNAKPYEPFDCVVVNGTSYVCATPHAGQNPSNANSAFWTLENLNPNPTSTDINLTYDIVRSARLAHAEWPNAQFLGMRNQQGESDMYFPVASVPPLSAAQEQARQAAYYKLLTMKRVAMIEYVRKSLGQIHLPVSDGEPLKPWSDSAPLTGPGLLKAIRDVPAALSARRNGYHSFMNIVAFPEITQVYQGDKMNVHFTSSDIRSTTGPKHAKALIELNQLLASETAKYQASLAKKDLDVGEHDVTIRDAFAHSKAVHAIQPSKQVVDDGVIGDLPPLDWMPSL